MTSSRHDTTSRRRFLAGAAAIGSTAFAPVGAQAVRGATAGPTGEELARRLRDAAAAPVLRRELFAGPVTLRSVELLRSGRFFLVRAESVDGAVGLAEGHADVLRSAHPILVQRVASVWSSIRRS